jgi:hypothetical protein
MNILRVFSHARKMEGDFYFCLLEQESLQLSKGFGIKLQAALQRNRRDVGCVAALNQGAAFSVFTYERASSRLFSEETRFISIKHMLR